MDDFRLKELESKIAASNEFYKSSAQEFDKQIVYIAGGGLALTLTFAKDIASITNSHFLLILFATWIAFAVALLLNLLSHRKSAQAFDDLSVAYSYSRESYIAKKHSDENHINDLFSKAENKSKNVDTLNNISFYATIVGIAGFILFVFLNVFTMSEKKSVPEKNEDKRQENIDLSQKRGTPIPKYMLKESPPPIEEDKSNEKNEKTIDDSSNKKNLNGKEDVKNSDK